MTHQKPPEKIEKASSLLQKRWVLESVAKTAFLFLSKSTFSGAMGTFFRGCKWRFSDSDGQTMWNLSFFQAPQPQPHEENSTLARQLFWGVTIYLYIYISSRWGKFSGLFDKILANSNKLTQTCCKSLCLFLSFEKRIQNDINLGLMGMMMKMPMRMMTILYCTISYYTILYFTILYYTILFFSILY